MQDGSIKVCKGLVEFASGVQLDDLAPFLSAVVEDEAYTV